MFNPFGRKPSRDVEVDVSSMLDDLRRRLETDSDRPLNTPEQLRAALKVFDVFHTFDRGDLVMWKPEMQNRRSPAYGEPIIVVNHYEDATYADDSDGVGSSQFREPLDLVCGEMRYVGDDATFVLFWYDSRRFQPYVEADE
jgi:hypothetical protein